MSSLHEGYASRSRAHAKERRERDRKAIADAKNESPAIKQAFFDKYVGTDFADTFDGKEGMPASLREYVDGTTQSDRDNAIERHKRWNRRRSITQ